MRVRDPVGGPPDLARFFDAYDRHFRDLPGYKHALQRLIACYSLGSPAPALVSALDIVVTKAVARNADLAQDPGGHRLFGHQGRFPELLRDALVLLSFGLCLRAPPGTIRSILACCERGDPLLETMARAAAPGAEAPVRPPGFTEIFGELYEAVAVSGTARELRIKAYLDVWYSEKMQGFSFRDVHLLTDQPDYVGYWCFEAAGLVAALDTDDALFRCHPHYPRDLVTIYRRA
jgi:hypothetical protein